METSDSLREDGARQKDCLEKLTWKSMAEACAAVAYARWQYGELSSDISPYKCRYCREWHLARRPLEDE